MASAVCVLSLMVAPIGAKVGERGFFPQSVLLDADVDGV